MESTHSTTLSKTKTYCGRQQPTVSRVPETPMVDYMKGGSDFRVFNYSSLGRQTLGFKHTNSAASTPFAQSSRFQTPAEKNYPKYIGQYSSMRKQKLSHKPSAPSVALGTSTRDSDLKLYAVYTVKR